MNEQPTSLESFGLGHMDTRVVDWAHPIQTRPYSIIYPGTMIDPDGQQIDIVVKKITAMDSARNMFENDLAMYEAASDYYADDLKLYLSPSQANSDRTELTLLNLKSQGFGEHLEIISGMPVPNQRVLFVDLMCALSRISYVAGSMWREPRDFAGYEAKGIWVRPAGKRYDIAFTDFGLWNVVPDDIKWRDGMPTNLKRLWLEDTEDGKGLVDLFPFVEKRDGEITISDPILGSYQDTKIDLKLADLLTKILHGEFELRSSGPSGGSATLMIWGYFEKLRREVNVNTLLTLEGELPQVTLRRILGELFYGRQKVTEPILAKDQLTRLAARLGTTQDEIDKYLSQFMAAESAKSSKKD